MISVLICGISAFFTMTVVSGFFSISRDMPDDGCVALASEERSRSSPIRIAISVLICTVTVVTVEEAYFQCARAIVRSGIWTAERQVDPKMLPTPGAMLAAVTGGEVGGEAYDREWPGRAAKTLW